ncbi:GDP-L-fucose synthase [Sporichthya sp.]|uniref:GDP-L-fucose synthase family protein n=1 Tax=Sporichthya sp. TaxID=65475 RepID=UPI0017E0BD10|nr:GDP-L-fucose synthase [Sporichthya sp.]MBA3741952.1 GDP-L-fucose synthase [Sporichthya sp.]
MLSRTARIHIAGHRGLVGSAVWRSLENEGFSDLVGRSSTELDLRDRAAVDTFYDEVRPEYVVLAAARVGGILANSKQPAEFLSDNLRIQLSVLDAAARIGVRKVLFLGSSCIYPRLAPQPISEDALLTGPLEKTNDAYAIAKIAGILHIQALRRQYGLHYVSAMPTNLYGPGDNFDLETSHVLPAMIRKFHDAKASGASHVTMWGTGSPRREFLHVDDMARACLVLLESYDDDAPINIGCGDDVTIAELAATVADVVGFEGDLVWDTTKPDGTPRKLLNTSRINALGWRPEIELRDGLKSTYEWFVENMSCAATLTSRPSRSTSPTNAPRSLPLPRARR